MELPRLFRRSFRLLRDGETPLWRKGLLLFVILYLISPFDLIPEAFTPLLGMADDLVVLLFALRYLLKDISPPLSAEQRAKKRGGGR